MLFVSSAVCQFSSRRSSATTDLSLPDAPRGIRLLDVWARWTAGAHLPCKTPSPQTQARGCCGGRATCSQASVLGGHPPEAAAAQPRLQGRRQLPSRPAIAPGSNRPHAGLASTDIPTTALRGGAGPARSSALMQRLMPLRRRPGHRPTSGPPRALQARASGSALTRINAAASTEKGSTACRAEQPHGLRSGQHPC